MGRSQGRQSQYDLPLIGYEFLTDRRPPRAYRTYHRGGSGYARAGYQPYLRVRPGPRHFPLAFPPGVLFARLFFVRGHFARRDFAFLVSRRAHFSRCVVFRTHSRSGIVSPRECCARARDFVLNHFFNLSRGKRAWNWQRSTTEFR